MKKVLEYIPLISIFLVYLGCLDLYAYYGMFNINILPYLETSEILLSFFNNGFIIIGLALFVLFDRLIDTKIENSVKSFANKQGEKVKSKLQNYIDGNITLKEIHQEKKYYKRLVNIAIIVKTILTPIIFLIYLFFLLATLRDVYLSIASIYFMVVYIRYFNDYFEKYIPKTITDEIKYLISIFLFMTLVVYLLAMRQLYQTKEISKKRTHTIYMEKDTITTTNNFYLIGKTKDYYFFYDSLYSETTTIKADLVTKIQIRIKH